ncbi:pilus assembly protein Flp/PilA [Microterricola gilva]|uniref:Pilus assembly protein Flp/PilA n=1 Tax=Microterricola gilva TaxID=393267 RepID=A0A4Q8ARI5_9MICO|nr:Flp family type IVb pilin [Microterricola gilva]RZU66669.1 pilus assembly protein Flp/PilA [Microterricola gilva]
MKFITDIQARINSMRSTDDGATAVEYGLLVSLIAVVIIGGVTALGLALNGMFDGVADEIVAP